MSSKVISGPVVQSEIMSAQETAEYLKISYWLLMKMVRESQIPAFRCGKKVMFRKSTIDSFISALEHDNYQGTVEMG